MRQPTPQLVKESRGLAHISSVTVVVVAWNGAELLGPCLSSLADSVGVEFETWVLDNASSDSSASVASAHPSRPRVVRLDRNLGFAGAAAHAVATVSTPFLVLLNQDTVVATDWLASLLAAFTDDVAAVTSKVVLFDGLLNNTGVIIGRDGYGRDRGLNEPDDGRYSTAGPVPAFSGTAVALRVSACLAAGSFDPTFFMYYEDTDLSWRLALAGWRVLYAPTAVVRHHHGASSSIGSASFAYWNERNRLLMLGKCSPLSLFSRELARFSVITALLPLRRLRGALSLPGSPGAVPRPHRVAIPAGHQFRTAVRLRVLAAILSRLPSLLTARRQTSRLARQAGTTRAAIARRLLEP